MLVYKIYLRTSKMLRLLYYCRHSIGVVVRYFSNQDPSFQRFQCAFFKSVLALLKELFGEFSYINSNTSLFYILIELSTPSNMASFTHFSASDEIQYMLSTISS